MERRRIEIRGTVQGVGFRPYVYNLAIQHRLGGSVQNRSGSVLIRAEGDRATLDRFLEELLRRAPPLAHIDAIAWAEEPTKQERDFCILASESDLQRTPNITPDAACCADCLRELFDPADRRYRYPFLNCTNCGPRLTIVTGAPYDRERTTMASFAMCAECRAEYYDPSNRRFHAQPVACPRCGRK
ncbi:MAG TPA: acylphosphatase [Gemmataceae bacterium]